MLTRWFRTGSSLSTQTHTVINVGHPDGPPRLITCVRSSQGFDWNQGTILPSHYTSFQIAWEPKEERRGLTNPLTKRSSSPPTIATQATSNYPLRWKGRKILYMRLCFQMRRSGVCFPSRRAVSTLGEVGIWVCNNHFLATGMLSGC